MNKNISVSVIFGALFVILLSTSALAQMGVPHQFYGSVTINGEPASDGTAVVAKMDSVVVAVTTTSGGSYGLIPNIFYIEDPNGDRVGEIKFHVNDVDTEQTYIFENGASTELDLSITVSTPPSSNPPSPGGGGCVSKWECTDWSACVDEEQTRTCVDVRCGRKTGSSKPTESQNCTVSTVPTGVCVSGQNVCAGDALHVCQDEEWMELETCEHGCDNSDPGNAVCLTDGDDDDQGEDFNGNGGPGGPPTGFFLDPASLAAIIIVIVVIIIGAAGWKLRGRGGVADQGKNSQEGVQ